MSPRTPRPTPPPLPFLLLLTVLPHLLTAIPPTLLTPLTAGRDIACFNLTTPSAYPVDLNDCPPALDLLFHDPTGVMSLQRFSRDPFPPPPPPPSPPDLPTFRIPYAWQTGACQVLLTSGADDAVDTFRLADVIAKAMRIIEQCPPGSKRALGGMALVGHGESFFVAVNGPPDYVVGGVGGGGDDGHGDGREGVVLVDEGGLVGVE